MPLEVTDGTYPLGPEQFEAADVHSSEDRDRVPRVHTHDEHRGKVVADVGCTGGEGLVEPAGLLLRDIVHLGESLAPQELFRNILGGQTEAEAVVYPEHRRLGRRFCGDRPGGHAKEPRRSREGHSFQEPPPAERSSVLGTHRTLLSRCWSGRHRACRPVDSSSLAQIGAAPNGTLERRASTRPMDLRHAPQIWTAWVLVRLQAIVRLSSTRRPQ